MDLKQTAKVFKGLSLFTSTDKTRLMLNHVYVRDDKTLDATDGHRLIRVTIPEGHNLPTGFYDPKKAQAMCKADVVPSPVQADAAWEYPDFLRVMPRKDDMGAATRFLGVDTRYLADCAEGIQTALAPFGFDHAVRIQLPDNQMEPVRMDAEAFSGATAVVILMPRRI
jgi:hypothetical protein